MNGVHTRLTKTFTDIKRYGEEHNIDDSINDWVRMTDNVIMDVFASEVSWGTDATKLRYVVTYMEPEAFSATYAVRQQPCAGKEKGAVPVVKPVVAPGRRGPTPEEIAAATAQIAKSRAERQATGPIPVRQDLAGVNDVLRIRGGKNTGRPLEVVNLAGETRLLSDEITERTVTAGVVENELDNIEEAIAWQEEEEGASPEEARKEAEALANELQASILTGELPSRRRTGTAQEQRVVKNPTPPILVGTTETEIQTPPEQKAGHPQFLEGIPTRRRRR